MRRLPSIACCIFHFQLPTSCTAAEDDVQSRLALHCLTLPPVISSIDLVPLLLWNGAIVVITCTHLKIVNPMIVV